MALGSEEFLAKVRGLLRGRKDKGREPALSALRRMGKARPEEVEEVAGRVHAEERPARRRRLVMYALQEHSCLRSSEVARRCGRTSGAVRLAARHLEAEAAKSPALAARLESLRQRFSRN